MMKYPFLKNKKENNRSHNSKSTAIICKAEFNKSNDELEELIDLTNSEVLKSKFAMT